MDTQHRNHVRCRPSGREMGGLAPMWVDYAYDTKTGNRTSVTTHSSTGAVSSATYAYPAVGSARPHAVTGVTGPASFNPGTYGYDAAGNMTTRPGQQATFNELGKVSKVVTGTASQTNIYHADGSLLLRVSSVEGASLTVGDTVLTQATGSTVVAGLRTYTGAEGKPVAQRSAKTGTTGTTMTWLFTNLEGSVDTQTVANTGVTQRNYRDPYGAPITMTGGVWGDGNGYMNKPATASSALTTVGARTYDPVLGKFLSVDPVIDANLPQQNTGYTYSGNNPITYSDPSGLKFAIDAPSAGGRSVPPRSNSASALFPQPLGKATGRQPANSFFTQCRFDSVCSAGSVQRTSSEVTSLKSMGYEPFGDGPFEIFLNTQRSYKWTIKSRPSTDITSVTLRYDPDYKWVLSTNSTPYSFPLAGDSAREDGWDVIVDTVGKSADQETYEQQYNCHVLGAGVETVFGNGSWDFESSRPSNPGWAGGMIGRVSSTGSAAAACSW
ncbi:RHS repeat-associated core domain-containing protein [Microbacterium sp.]|uniref:RHS repeat-associated core domain-containing protein n=1 Tax=Microbacterium sp. TaxID=51671 RepID=UPI002735269B|nr:RHS repeat-associated core domain-containing protein [Microbacterium sp.]MDP3949737.1 RHS repeat-associated core domain-containing protein [Microbacterium sp.]